MTHQEIIKNIAATTAIDKAELTALFDGLTDIIAESMLEGRAVGLHGFGTFESKKREERLWLHPATGQRFLLPPKLLVNFKPGNVLKEKLQAK